MKKKSGKKQQNNHSINAIDTVGNGPKFRDHFKGADYEDHFTLYEDGYDDDSPSFSKSRNSQTVKPVKKTKGGHNQFKPYETNRDDFGDYAGYFDEDIEDSNQRKSTYAGGGEATYDKNRSGIIYNHSPLNNSEQRFNQLGHDNSAYDDCWH